MELPKNFPLSFFEKSRPNTPKDSLKKTEPFKWSKEKEILSGKYKKDKIIQLPKEQKVDINLCKIGDIIAVPNFIGDGNNLVNTHYFVVVNDRRN